MLLIDTSLWVSVYRDASGAVSQRVQSVIGDEEFVFCQFVRAELLQGCRDEREWTRTLVHLDFEAIATVRPLKHLRVQLTPSAQG